MLLGLLSKLAVAFNQVGVQVLQMVLKRALSGESTATEGTLEGLQLHMDALGVVFQVRN